MLFWDDVSYEADMQPDSSVQYRFLILKTAFYATVLVKHAAWESYFSVEELHNN